MNKKLKLVLAPVALALLVSCGGGGGSNSDLLGNPVVLADGNQTVRLDRTDRYSLDLTSSNNRVTIAAGSRLDTARVAGTGNTLSLEGGVSATLLEVSGANDVVAIADHVTVATLRVTGANALVTIADSSAAVSRIELAGSNGTVSMPAGYTSNTVVVDSGANNHVVER